jgi:hypothetical protein
MARWFVGVADFRGKLCWVDDTHSSSLIRSPFDKEPLIFRVLGAILLANTFAMLLLGFAGKHFFPGRVLETLRWYTDHSVAIQFILLALLAATLVAFRKRVRYIRRG